MPQAIVIGAGPAGCVAAILLSRGGWDVRLIEQHRFPRDKVCGECLSALGYAVIEHLGLSEGFQQLEPVRLIRSGIYSPNGKVVEIDLPEPMWGLSRGRFDGWLLEMAVRANVQIYQPMRCERLDVSADHPTVCGRDLITNQVCDFSADWILVADGKGAMMKRALPATVDMGMKAHFENISGRRDAIGLFGVGGHYGGIAPIESGRWNVAFSVPRWKIAQSAGRFDELFTEAIKENFALSEQLDGARRVSPWLVSALPRFGVGQEWARNVIPLGNAAAAIEPVGGEGMGLAMRSAEMAAGMLLSGDINLKRLRGEFQKLWRMRAISCRAAAMVVSRPMIANRIIPTLRHAAPLTRGFSRWMGK